MNFVKSIVLVCLISACSYQFHEKKFYQKGGTFNCIADTITVTDTIIDSVGNVVVVTRDSIIAKPVVNYVPSYVYKYRYLQSKDSTRADTKIKQAEIKANSKVNKAKVRSDGKIARKQAKQGISQWWLLLIPLSFLAGFFIKRN